MKPFTLSNGVAIPPIGFGTWQIPDGDVVYNAVRAALSAGYRAIDTAAVYGNETGVGAAIRDAGIPRSEVFLTTKVWNDDQGYESTLRAFGASRAKLGVEYVDLYLIHWPAVNRFPDHRATNLETWRAMERLYREGKVRAIGVSNFLPHHLEPLWNAAEVKPMVDQVELHPGNPADDVVAWCRARGILVQAWSPMMRGHVFDYPVLAEIASKHARTVPQVVLRWILDRGIHPLTKSVTPARIKENLDVFSFTLDDEDEAKIATLSGIGRFGSHPDLAKY
ncbi:MAG: aldo/keto reductase [Candidatus Izemoplasmatales bacterium]